MTDSTVLHWLPEYDSLLEKIASTDEFELVFLGLITNAQFISNSSDWTILRDAIKYKIEKNISFFLSTTERPPLPAPYLPITTPSGGLKLPPFLPRKHYQMHLNDAPVSYLDHSQANALKLQIFAQLDEFESNPPFTIQRLCELCVDPKKHYNSVGKYLRAVEKSILVTSTWDAFPPLTESELNSSGRSATILGSTLQSAPSTPLFSPIPFLHDDARRSKSRSPPPTPLTLNPSAITLGGEPTEIKALGLVDELDDPSPGHMSDHPTALSSVTSVGDTLSPKPFLGSLDQRFVKSEEDSMDISVAIPQPPTQETDVAMELDDDKENTKS